MKDNPLAQIKEFIEVYFTYSDLEDFWFTFPCFQDFEKEVTRNASLKDISREMVKYCQRHGKLELLIKSLEKYRPVPFVEVFKDKEILLQKINGLKHPTKEPDPPLDFSEEGGFPPTGIIDDPPSGESKSKLKNIQGDIGVPQKTGGKQPRIQGITAGAQFQENIHLPPTNSYPNENCQLIPDREEFDVGGIKILRAKMNESVTIRVRSSSGGWREAVVKLEKPGRINIQSWYKTELVGKGVVNKVYEVKNWPGIKHHWRIERLPKGRCIKLDNNDLYQFSAKITQDIWKIEHRASHHRPDRFVLWPRISDSI